MIEVIVTTHTNPLWLARCVASLRHYYPPDYVCHVESETQERTWMGNILAGLSKVQSDLVFVIQDDAQLMCLRPSWLDELAKPFADDPLVAISCMTATSVGYPHQSVRMSLPPGPYYTSQFIPIAFLARPDALRQAVNVMEDDLTGDHEPSLWLMQNGYKIVMNTHLPVYHEGMQTNLRVYGGENPNQWITSVRPVIQDRITKKYPASLIQRMEQMEMVPMVNYHRKTSKGTEVLM